MASNVPRLGVVLVLNKSMLSDGYYNMPDSEIASPELQHPSMYQDVSKG